MMEWFSKSDSAALPAEKRRYFWLLIQLYRNYFIWFLLLALPVSLLAQWLIFGDRSRFLFGFWITAIAIVAALGIYLFKSSRTAAWLATNIQFEPLWLLIWTPTRDWKQRESLAFLRSRFIPRVAARPAPWILQLIVAIILALSLQMPRVVPYSGWLVAGTFGPSLTVREKFVQDIQWTVAPPTYVGHAPQPAVPTDNSVQVLVGSTIILQVTSSDSAGLVAVAKSIKSTRIIKAASRTGDLVQFFVPISEPVTLSFERHTRGLAIVDPDNYLIQVREDEKPVVDWVKVDDAQEIEEDDVWRFRIGASDQYGIHSMGYAIVDESGTTVTDGVRQDYAPMSTETAFRLLPEAWLDRLQTGMWTLIPLAWDLNPYDPMPGSGRSVTLTVVSRYDLHKQRLELLQALFSFGLGVLADAWEEVPVRPDPLIRSLNALWKPIQQAEKEFWSAFGVAELAQGVEKLRAALKTPQLKPLAVEEAVMHLMRGQALEQKAKTSDRLGAVERAEQDLMAALADETASDRELMEMLSELQKKLQSLSETLKDQNAPLPQENYNKEAFSEANQRNNEKSLQDVLDALRGGDRQEAMDLLKEFMEQVDKMRDSINESQPESGPPGASQESEGQSGNQQPGDEVQKKLQEAQQQLRKAIASEVKALEQSRGQEQNEQTIKSTDKAAASAAGTLQESAGELQRLDEELGGNLGKELETIEQASKEWSEAEDSLRQTPAKGQKEDPSGSQLSEFRQKGEKSLQILRQGLQSLQQKEQKLKQQKKQGGSSKPKDEKFREEELENSAAKNRRDLFKNFSEGVPEQEKGANKNYFHRLAR